jgi:hypothetical protein
MVKRLLLVVRTKLRRGTRTQKLKYPRISMSLSKKADMLSDELILRRPQGLPEIRSGLA